MEDKLRYVLSVRTLIEMTLLRAGRIASVASIEELMKAVRALKEGGVIPQTSPAPAMPKESAPKPDAAEAPQGPSLDRQAILDDPKLNGILKSMPGTKIVDIKER